MTITQYIPAQANGSSWLAIMDRAGELSEAIANTDFVPRSLRGNQPAILAAILYGHEVGLGPMQSLAKIAVIDGKPTLAAEAQRALILSHGHELWVEESTNTRATIAGRRRGGGRQTSRVTWTLDDAKRARIAGKQNWQTYPRQMLLARATAELARAVFADAIGGLAASEEAEEADVDPADTPVVETERPATRRRRRLAAAPAEPEPQPQGEAPGPDLMNDAQRRKLMASFRERGISDRDERLRYSAAVIGREITSSSELTVLEASQLIEALAGLTPADETSRFEPPAGVQKELEQPVDDEFPEGF
jgi:hypothetical protein